VRYKRALPCWNLTAGSEAVSDLNTKGRQSLIGCLAWIALNSARFSSETVPITGAHRSTPPGIGPHTSLYEGISTESAESEDSVEGFIGFG